MGGPEQITDGIAPGTPARRAAVSPAPTLALVRERPAPDGGTPVLARCGRPQRVLTTVLCTDVVDSTGHALALGDDRWLALLVRHQAMVTAEIRREAGHLVVAVGDGTVATFDGAAAAVRCAGRIARLSRDTGLEVRCGLHCGESERRARRVGGIVFHVAARIAQLASPGEVLVSETLTRLVAGSTIHFRRRGRRLLRGLPGLWVLYVACSAAS
jgi:class 3 adenylate cyclase